MHKTFSTQTFETKFCGVIGVTVSYVAFAVLVIGAFLSCLAIPDVLVQKQSSVWNCPDGLNGTFDNETCSGVDLSTLDESVNAISESVNANAEYMYTHFLLVPVPRLPEVGVSIEIDLLINVTDDSDNKTDERISSTVDLHCAIDQTSCDPIVGLIREAGHFNASFRFNTNDDDIKRAFTQAIGDVLIIWEFANPDFSKFSMIFRIVHIAISLIFLVIYFVNILRIKNVKTVEQKWLIVYLIFCIVYDNPLVPFQMHYPSFILSGIDSFFFSAFIAFAMFYVLLVLGGFINKKTSIKYFILPRLLFSCVVFVVHVAYELSQLSAPIIAGMRDRTTVVEVLRYVDFGMDILFLMWFGYTVVRIFVISRLHPLAVKGRYRAYVLFVILVFLIYVVMVVFTQFVLINKKDIQYLLLISLTCANAFGWILTVWLMPTSFGRITRITLTQSLRPQKSGGKKDYTLDAEGEAEAAVEATDREGRARLRSNYDGDRKSVV